MSLRPQVFYLVPEETARVARAANPKGNVYLRMYDALGTIFTDQHFAPLFPAHGQPAEAPVRLALTTVMQFAEGLSDRQAADAVRTRLDWKYLLCLELTDPGFHFSVLSAFRERLIVGEAEYLLFDTLLNQLRELGLLKARGTQRTDSTHVLAAVRSLNRLERVGETLRAALNSIAVVDPQWLQQRVPADWYDRYADRVENYRLPKAETERAARASVIGQDGRLLLSWIDDHAAPRYLRELPAVQIVRQVWHDHYTDPPEPIAFRPVKALPPSSQQITSPYDPEARYATKRSVDWIGYTVHLTETCDPERPCLITHGETTVATVPDDQVIAPIHTALAARDLLPTEHLMDAGYTTAGNVADSRATYQVDVVGPMAEDASWQGRAGTGFAKQDFRVDWDLRRVTCPAGVVSRSWTRNPNPQKDYAFVVHWAKRACRDCAYRSHCTKRTKEEPRELVLKTHAEEIAPQTARVRQTTPAFQQIYAQRAGVESAHAQAIRRCDLRHARYRGLAKTRLQHVLTAAALNLVRASAWLAEIPRTPTRRSPFARLQISTA